MKSYELLERGRGERKVYKIAKSGNNKSKDIEDSKIIKVLQVWEKYFEKPLNDAEIHGGTEGFVRSLH